MHATSTPQDPAEARAALERIGRLADAQLPIGEAALLLAVPDALDLSVVAGREHLGRLVTEARAEARLLSGTAAEDPMARTAMLARLLHERHGYQGDRDTYDDPANANLLRVMERRRGLPVALGILWLHLLRALRWRGAGLDLPGHFVLGVQGPDRVVTVDVFAGGKALDPPGLRALLRNSANASLQPGSLPSMTDRAVLLRLQNNLLVRRLEAGDLASAYACVSDMLRLAPDAPPLLREAGLIARRLGRLQDATRLLHRFMERAPDEAARRRAASVLDEIRQHLN